MKQPDRVSAFPRQIHTLPLSWLSLSVGKRLLIVALSYGLGVAGLWFLFPLVHNGASMFLPIVSACWLFRYRGLLISLVLNGIAFQLTYLFLLRGMLPDRAFVEGGIIGFGTSLGLGLVVCWLRTAVDLVQVARQQALAAEQARLLTLLKERQATLAYEQQRKINELKDQFLLNVSHELRTPLTMLGCSLELLSELDEHLDPMKRAHLLKEALASQEELVDLVNRVLDATTVVGEIPLAKLEAVRVHQILQEVLAQQAQKVNRLGVVLGMYKPTRSACRYPSRSWSGLTHSSCAKCCSICLPMSSSMFPHRQRSALRLRKQILLPQSV